MGLCSKRVCFQQDFSLPLSLTQAAVFFSFPANPVCHRFTSLVHCHWFLFFTLSVSEIYFSFTLLSIITFLFPISHSAPCCLVHCPSSPFHFLPSHISLASHNEEQIGFLTRLIIKEHRVDARLS